MRCMRMAKMPSMARLKINSRELINFLLKFLIDSNKLIRAPSLNCF